MEKLTMVKTSDLKRELDERGYDTTCVVPTRKTWCVGFSKTCWQYIDGIEADTEGQAINIARSKIRESGWTDYGRGVEVDECTED